MSSQGGIEGVTTRGIYLDPDMADIVYASTEASMEISKPRETDRGKLKRMGRYLNGFPRVVQRFP